MLKILDANLKQFLEEIPNDPAVSNMVSTSAVDWESLYNYFCVIFLSFCFLYAQYSQKVKEVTESDRKLDLEALEKYKALKDSAADGPAAPLISPGVKFVDYHLAYAKQLEGLSEILVCVRI